MWVTIGLFALTEAFFSASPGPAVVLVMSAALISGWRGANASILGVLAGNIVYFAIAGILIVTATGINDDVLLYIKLAGASYLFWLLGRQYLFPAKETEPSEDQSEALILEAKQNRRFFYAAFAMQIANPKNILFFSAFLPQFVDPSESVALQILILGSISIAIEYAILFAYAAIAISLSHKVKGAVGERLGHLGNVTMVIAVVWGIFFT